MSGHRFLARAWECTYDQKCQFLMVVRIVPDMAVHTAMAEVHAKCGAVASPSGGVRLFAWCVLYTRMSRRYAGMVSSGSRNCQEGAGRIVR
jgi:putative hemolysin